MGSDNRDGPSRLICTHASLRVYHNRIRLFYFLLGVPPLLAAVVVAVLLLPPPEIVLADSFASNTYNHLPAHCEKTPWYLRVTASGAMVGVTVNLAWV
jgi:hypothetical protein